MKMRQIVLVGFLTTAWLVGASLAVDAVNNGYSLDWFTFDGGGGTSSSGSYNVSGTIGQPDAGTLTGGAYTLLGGFWGETAAGYRLYLPVIRR